MIKLGLIFIILSLCFICLIYYRKNNNIFENLDNNTTIVSIVDGKTCGLEWGGTLDSNNERNAKWDCSGTADPLIIEGTQIYSMADGKKCGLEWGGTLDSNNERNAKWDCSGRADSVIIEGNKIYSMADGKKCGLEWGGTLDSNNERNAKWDCSGSADPVVIRRPNNASNNASNNSSNVNSAPYNPPISLNLSGLDAKTFTAIKQEINRQYNMDIEAIRNLGAISKSLLTGKNYHNVSANGNPGTLTIPADVIIEGKLTSKKEVEFTNKNSSVMNVLPKGVILAWYQDKSKIPNGWALCNGQNGTPDLRDRFIYGGNSRHGNRGGAREVTLTTGQMPRHRHKYVHSHYSGFSENNDSRNPDYGAYKYGKAVRSRLGDIDTGGLEGNEDRIFVSDPVTHGTATDNDYTENNGSSQAHNNMPPYHTLFYIMKL